MQWTVEGADRKTGEERKFKLEAATKADAERLAAAKGVLVSTIAPIAGRAVVEQPQHMTAAVTSQSPVVTAIPAPSPIEYASPNSPDQRVPRYMGLRIGASILGMLAMGFYVLGVVMVVGTIYNAIYPPPTRNMLAPDPLIQAIAPFIASLFVLAWGAVLHLVAEGALAFRDIARNSFNR